MKDSYQLHWQERSNTGRKILTLAGKEMLYNILGTYIIIYMHAYVYKCILVPRLAAAVTSTNTQLDRVTGTVSSQDVVR